MDLIYDCQNKLEEGEICSKRNKIHDFENTLAVRCKKCSHEQALLLSESLTQSRILDLCPICKNKDFYTQRDFPQQAGCIIVLIGAALVPWTYGLSLAIVAALDFFLFKMLPNITVCYHCLSKIRGTRSNVQHKPFDHNLFEQLLKTNEKEKK